MKYKIGETLWSCFLEEGKRPSYNKWRIRSKRGGRFHAVMITEFTWVKLKWGKDQTRGFAKHIPDFCRESCRVGEKFFCLFRTKGQALRSAKKYREAREKRISNTGIHATDGETTH